MTSGEVCSERRQFKVAARLGWPRWTGSENHPYIGVGGEGGIYFLWGVVWSTYWFELFYYEDLQAIDYVYYWAGFAAWGVRALAWSKKRTLQPAT